jgi:hypothetical protein
MADRSGARCRVGHDQSGGAASPSALGIPERRPGACVRAFVLLRRCGTRRAQYGPLQDADLVREPEPPGLLGEQFVNAVSAHRTLRPVRRSDGQAAQTGLIEECMSSDGLEVRLDQVLWHGLDELQ